MEIKKTITINLTKKGKKIICDDSDTLTLIMGTKSVIGNLHYYGIEKKKNKFIVDVNTIKYRVSVLEDRKKKLERSLEIMKQVVR